MLVSPYYNNCHLDKTNNQCNSRECVHIRCIHSGITDKEIQRLLTNEALLCLLLACGMKDGMTGRRRRSEGERGGLTERSEVLEGLEKEEEK